MKTFATWVVLPLLAIALHNIGYRQGIKRARAGAVDACVREMTPTCTAVSLVNLRPVERIIAARNRQPIVVECPR